MSGRGRGPGWSEVLRVHPTPRWGGSMPAFHPRSGLCCCLFASSARAALSWGADGPVPPRTSGAAGRPLCGLAGKSSPGTEHGAQPCTKPSCRTVPALPTSFPAPGGRGRCLSPHEAQAGADHRQGVLRACGTGPKLQPRRSGPGCCALGSGAARAGHAAWQSPPGPRWVPAPPAFSPRPLPVHPGPRVPVFPPPTACCLWPSPHIPTSHPRALGNWHEPRGEGSVGTCHGPRKSRRSQHDVSTRAGTYRSGTGWKVGPPGRSRGCSQLLSDPPLLPPVGRRLAGAPQPQAWH